MGALPRQSRDTNFVKLVAPFLQRGFAIAASDYSIQGFALPQGVKETEELRQYFVKKYGKTDTTFIVGHSMGGGVVTAKYTNGQGHCAFTPEQTAQAFDEQRAWAKTGKKAKAGFVE